MNDFEWIEEVEIGIEFPLTIEDLPKLVGGEFSWNFTTGIFARPSQKWRIESVDNMGVHYYRNSDGRFTSMGCEEFLERVNNQHIKSNQCWPLINPFTDKPYDWYYE